MTDGYSSTTLLNQFNILKLKPIIFRVLIFSVSFDCENNVVLYLQLVCKANVANGLRFVLR